jgi:PAS domain S-box-containing protein
MSGAMVYFIVAILIAIVTPYYREHPLIVAIVSFLTFAFAVTRVVAARRILTSRVPDAALGAIFTSAVYATFAVWGGFCAWTVHLYGTEWTTMLLLLATAALAGGASLSLAPNTKLASRCLVVLVGPTIAFATAAGDIRHGTVALLSAVYLGFLLTQTRSTHDIEEKVGLEFNFRAVLDCSPDAINLVDSGGVINFANRKSQELFGYSNAEMTGRPIESLIPGYRAARTAGERDGDAQAGDVGADLTALRKDGAVIPVEIRTSDLAAESVSTSIVAIRDITARRQAQMLLHLSDAFINIATIGMFWFTSDGRFTRVNRESCSMTGYSERELLTMTVTDLMNHTPEQWDAGWRNLLRKGSVSYEAAPIRKDGSRLPVEVDVTVVDFEGVKYGVGFARDIAERKRLEEQYRQAQKLETIGQLAGGIAHDFNNLLTVINGYSRRALGERNLTDGLRNSIGEVLKAGERAADLTRQLLIFGRRQINAPKVVDVNEIVSQSESLLRRIVGENVRLKIVRGANLGPIRVDASQFHQVLLNLVANARDAMPEGGDVSIELAGAELDAGYVARHVGSRVGRFITLEVSDTGCGMDESTIQRVFEPFFTTKEQGTGLGLATVHGIVAQHGGWISLHSAPGAGTSLRTFWPRFEGTVPTERRPARQSFQVHGTETILLVEDQPEIRELAAEMLARTGYRVLTAGSGLEALSVCHRHAGPIQLLLTDVSLVGMNGRELASKIRERRPDIRVLFMSGYGEKAISGYGTPDHPLNFLPKPFTPDSLTAKVRSALTEGAPRARSAPAGGISA